MILDATHVLRLLSLAREIGKDRPLHDVHVSPWEVVFDRFSYRPDPGAPGVHRATDDEYVPPKVGPLRVEEASEPAARRSVPAAFSLLMYRRSYAHVGPRVMGDHLALAGLARCLLIPVLRPTAEPDRAFRLMFDLYRDDPRFTFAYCPPRGVSEADLVLEIDRLLARHPLRALKFNANVQGIDLAREEGREHVRRLLSACRATDLPLLVHGGVSHVLEDPSGRAFASMDNLASFEWRQAKAPVVLCHAGMFGCTADEVDGLLPRLERLLAANDNLFVEVSGLGFDALEAVLDRIDGERLVFGSDGLYFPPWSAVVRVLHAYERLKRNVGDEFVRMAGTNPARHVFREPRPSRLATAGGGNR